jgi:hypothetical protein
MRTAGSLLACLVLLGCGTAEPGRPEAPAHAHYDVTAKIAPDTGMLTAHVVLTLRPEDVHDGSAFVIGDWYDLRKVDAGPDVKLTMDTTDKPLKHLRKIVLSFARQPAGPIVLTMDYDGPLNEPGADEKDNSFSPDVMELNLETMWLPVRLDLSMPYTFDGRIDGIPENKIVVAQGDVVHSGDRVVVHRDTTDFDTPIVATTGLQEVAAPGVEIYARDLNAPFVKIFAKNAGPIMAYYTNLFGPLPPGPPVRLVVVPRNGGGYERRGFISTPDGSEDIKRDPNFKEWEPARFIAHEFSHAWWWDADPMSENYWLAESMAEYSSLRYTQFAFGDGPYQTFVDRKRDSAKTAGPIIGNGGGRPSRIALYQKGPLLLIDLEHKIGRPAMDKLLGILGRNHPHTTADFLKALSDVAGPQAAQDFETALKS